MNHMGRRDRLVVELTPLCNQCLSPIYIIIGSGEKQCTGSTTYTTIHRNKTVIVNQIKHIFIVLTLPTKTYSTYID